MLRVSSLLLLPLALAVVAPEAPAQLIKIQFKTEKDVKKFSKYTTPIGGEQMLVCEVKGDGITFDPSSGFTIKPDRIEVWITDPKDPTVVPYEYDDGELVPTNKKWVLGLSGSRIKNVSWFDRNQTFAGLAKEYGIRKEIVDGIERERDAETKGTAEWFRHHMRLVGAQKRLQSWLANTCYFEAADKLEKEIGKLEKTIAKEAQEYRLQSALDSIKMVETPEELVEAAKEIVGDLVTFKVQESEHIRIVYCSELQDAQVRELLKLGETVIDGFKQEFVDPYYDVDFRDQIPDGLIQEFFWGPTDHKRSYEMFLTEYYGLQWGKHKEKMLEGSGSNHLLYRPNRDLNYRILQEQNDLEGTVTHCLGHCLARFHYSNGSGLEPLAWLEEAVGYYLSFELLGRNSLTCFQWRDEEAQRYRKPKKEELKEGEKTAVMGMRDAFNAMALAEGPKIDAMSLKTLFELSNADFAKGWSFYDYISRRMGKEGQLWLRAGCKAALKKNTMIQDWREASEQIFDVQGIDVFKKLDDEWRAFAEGEQAQGG